MLDRIAKAEVIGATLQVATNIFENFKINAKFVCVLVDEATQTNEANILLIAKNECKRLVLVGDQNQLGPVIS
jgi:superfamily I DNA and/or RNA helicase